MIEEEKLEKTSLEDYFFKSLYCFGGSLFLILLAFAFSAIFVVFWMIALITFFAGFVFALKGLNAWISPETSLDKIPEDQTRFKFGTIVLLVLNGIAFFGLTYLSSVMFSGHWSFG